MKDTESMASSVADAEVQVLQVLWQKSPQSAQEIIEGLQPQAGIKPQTIKTLINRLLTKGVIGFEESKRKYLYSPLISKTDFYKYKTERFLDRFYEGQLSPLISFFSNHGKLSKKDLSELKALLDQMESDDGK